MARRYLDLAQRIVQVAAAILRVVLEAKQLAR